MQIILPQTDDLLLTPLHAEDIIAIYMLLLKRRPSQRDIDARRGVAFGDEIVRVMLSHEFSAHLAACSDNGTNTAASREITDRFLKETVAFFRLMNGGQMNRSQSGAYPVNALGRWDFTIASIFCGAHPPARIFSPVWQARYDANSVASLSGIQSAIAKIAHEFTEHFSDYPALNFVAAQGADTNNLCELILGRAEGDQSETSVIQYFGLGGAAIRLLSQPEFETGVIEALLNDAPLPHDVNGVKLSAAKLRFAAALLGKAGVQSKQILEASKWSQLWGLLLGDGRVRALLGTKKGSAEQELLKERAAIAATIGVKAPQTGCICAASVGLDGHVAGSFRLYGLAPEEVNIVATCGEDMKVLTDAPLASLLSGVSENTFRLKADVHIKGAHETLRFTLTYGGRTIGPALSFSLELLRKSRAEALAKARWLVSKGRIADAIAHYESLIFSRALEGAAFWDLADLYFRLGMPERAFSVCREGLASFPESAEGLITQGRLFAGASQNKKASACFDRVPQTLLSRELSIAAAFVRWRQNHATAAASGQFTRLRHVFAVRGREQIPPEFPESLDEVSKAVASLLVKLSAQRGAVDVYGVARGLTEAELKLWAIASLQTMLDLFYTPAEIEAYLDWAVSAKFISEREVLDVFERNKQLHRLLPALAHMDAAKVQKTDLAIASLRLLEYGGLYDRAVVFAGRAIELSGGEDAGVLITSAKVAQRARHKEQAVKLYQQALTLRPYDVDILDNVIAAEIDLVTHSPLRSMETLQQNLKALNDRACADMLAQPGSTEARVRLARLFSARMQYHEALAILDDLVVSHPENLDFIAERLKVSERLEDGERIVADATRMLKTRDEVKFSLALVKGLRRLDRIAEAQAVLERHLDGGDVSIVAEHVRNFFFQGRFIEAVEMGDKQLEQFPANLELRLYVCVACLELGLIDRAADHAAIMRANGGDTRFPYDMPLLNYAILFAKETPDKALVPLNSLYNSLGCQSIQSESNTGRPTFDSFCGTGKGYGVGSDKCPPVFDGPLVSVVMTSFNMQDYVETAIKSIINQSYRNIEIIVVDDNSSDRTSELLLQLEHNCPQLKVILKSTNSGTYVSKNMGLLQARGEFIALQDSDDWSHPDRIAKSVAVLNAKPELMALTTDWIRMTTDGRVIIKAGGQVSHVSCISLVFRRLPVMQKIGFFDSVRIEADMEYIRRMMRVFGPRAVSRLHWPLLFGRAHSASLTASEEFGLTRTGYTKPRLDYQAAYKSWHRTIEAGQKAFLAFPQRRRAYDAPAIMLP